MGQYEIAVLLAKEESGMTVKEVANKTGLSSSSAGYGLRVLQKKKYVKKQGNKYSLVEDISKSDIDGLSPTPLSEALEK